MSDADFDSSLTVVVSTSDRPHMLRRQLLYLSAIRFPFRVVVADSSCPELARDNRMTVAGTPNLKLHYGYSEAGHLEVCRNVLKRVSTPYASVFADGDFAFPSTLRLALDFLERQPGYGTAVGITASDLHRKERCYVLPARSITNDSPVVRFRALARDWFSTLAGVHRTKQLHETYRNTAECTDFAGGRKFSEIMLSQMAVLQSRVHMIPRICCLQEDRGPDLSPQFSSTPLDRPAPQRLTRMASGWRLRRQTMTSTSESGLSPHSGRYQQFHDNLVSQLEAAGATLDHSELMLHQLYGHLKDKSAPIVSRKPPGVLAKVQRETVRHYGRLVNLVRSDRILQRRPLRHSDLQGLTSEWKEARHLIAAYPDGLISDDRIPAAA